MGVGSVTSMNSMSGMQAAAPRSTDSESKSIQNEITGVRQQMQKLSSEEISYEEKANEREKLQKEISGLNEELKQHQEEVRRAQQREALLEELREKQQVSEEKPSEEMQTKAAALEKTDEKNLPIEKAQSEETEESKEETSVKGQAKTPEEDENIQTDMPHKEMHEAVSAGASVQQAKQQGTVITKTQDGIVILKGEIKQDEQRGVDTKKKQAELERLEKQEERARQMQASILGKTNTTTQTAAKTSETEAKDRAWVNTENGAFQLARENQKAQQMFYVSISS